ncbi:GNAT family N-acetyltransferase [Candidatus Bipolaricaulota bacterium]|nr:GNAT family N-acetyltransferase [Candidatus Bipolaricaulota bacterium]
MIVTLRDITMDNFSDCINLKVAEHQKNFVASNMYSLAEAKADGVSNPYAIYEGDQLVGFIMYDFEPKESRGYITRLMVDESFQGYGYGREAITQVIDRLKAIPACREIQTGYMPLNEVARQLYESLGFKKVGEDDDGEILIRMSVDRSWHKQIISGRRHLWILPLSDCEAGYSSSGSRHPYEANIFPTISIVVSIDERRDEVVLKKKLQLAESGMRIMRPEEVANRGQVVKIHRWTLTILIRQSNTGRSCFDIKRCIQCFTYVRYFVFPEVVEFEILEERHILRGHIAHLNDQPWMAIPMPAVPTNDPDPFIRLPRARAGERRYRPSIERDPKPVIDRQDLQEAG